MFDIIKVFLLAFLGSIIALVGGVFFLFNKKWSTWLSMHSIPFAAGVLLTVSLLGLLPEAVHAIDEKAFLVVLVTFLTTYIFENFLFGIHHHEEGAHGSHLTSSIPLVIVGDTIHNLIDGVAIAASYFVNPGLGLITAVSTFLHEVPHEIGDFGILLKAGWKRKSIVLVNVISASSTFLGVLLVLILNQNTQIIGSLLAVAAGLFLYLGASDFLPHVHEGGLSPKRSIAALLIGVIVMVITITAVPHAHEEDGDHLNDIEKIQVDDTNNNGY